MGFAGCSKISWSSHAKLIESRAHINIESDDTLYSVTNIKC